MKILSSNKGISIIFAVILIVLLGLAGSIFAYLMASGSITSRQNLTSAEAKYAAKSGVEIAMYQEANPPSPPTFPTSLTAPSGISCPSAPVIPPGVTILAANIKTIGYIYGDLGNYDNYTSSFCALVAEDTTPTPSCLYIITSNGSAGGTVRAITTEAGIKYHVNSAGKIKCNKSDKKSDKTIFVENELPNSY